MKLRKMFLCVLAVMVMTLLTISPAYAAEDDDDLQFVQLNDYVGLDEFIASINKALKEKYTNMKANYVLRIIKYNKIDSDNDYDIYDCYTSDEALRVGIETNKAGRITSVRVAGVFVAGKTSGSGIVGCEVVTSTVLEYLGATQAQADKIKNEAQASEEAGQGGYAGFWCEKANRALLITHKIKSVSKDTTILRYGIFAGNKWRN